MKVEVDVFFTVGYKIYASKLCFSLILAKGGEWKVFYLKDKMLEDAKKFRCGPLHVGSRVKFQETERCKVSVMDLITLPKRIQPTGPQGETQFEGREVVQGPGCGQGHGHGRGRGRGV